jgi:hypothetical protein
MHFDKFGMHPLRVKWHKRSYRVIQVNGTWASNKGRNRMYHFHVSTDNSDSFELIFNTDHMNWQLGRVWIEG